MSGTKNFINKTGVEIKVRLLVRKGGDPQNGDSGKETFNLGVGESKVVTYGKETGDIFLNAVRVHWEDRGSSCAYTLRVEERGNWLDDLFNTNSIITFDANSAGKVGGSN